jgi:hypothetical protein
MSRILFVMLHPGFIRYYDDAVRALAAAGDQVHVAFEISRTKLGEDVTATRFGASDPRITCGTAPERLESVRTFLARSDRRATRSGGSRRRVFSPGAREEAWESLATTVRLALDYLRYFEPAFEAATGLRGRAEKRLPRVYRTFISGLARFGPAVRAAAAAGLRAIERLIPPNPKLDAFIREHNPDMLLVTPLIELGSQQVDYVKSARRLGIRSALCVASWDNLTTKGLIRVLPDHVIVWNDAQAAEAVSLHGAPPECAIVTGAQPFDRWFDARPSRNREEFCTMVGLDPARPFVLYVGSSTFIAPDEVPFFERWMSALRSAGVPAVAGASVLVRPHPANARQWRAFDLSTWPNVAMWPPIGTDPNAPDFSRDYFDSLYFSDAVVGINTSAQIEAGIIGRPVLTVRAPEFAHGQQGTLHFRHLVDGGLVDVADSLDEHVPQLAAAMAGDTAAIARRQAFVRSFVRPRGPDMRASAHFAKAIADLQRLPRPVPQPDPAWVPVLRPIALLLAYAARSLADDRPLWVYAMRPLVSASVWITAAGYQIRRSSHELLDLRFKRLRRAAWRAWYESAQYIRGRVRRTRKPLARMTRQAEDVVRRALRRQL